MYPSDISDKEWEILEPHVTQGRIGRPRKHSIRTIINAIRYMRWLSMEDAAERFSSMEDGV